MAIVQGLTTSFYSDCLAGKADFATPTIYTYKIALYNGNANLGSTTTTYTTDNEITGTGYTAGGKTLTLLPPVTDQTNEVAYISFVDVTWNPASFTTNGALIYNSTTGASVCVLNFGSTKTANSTFTVTFPAYNSSDAIIRFTN